MAFAGGYPEADGEKHFKSYTRANRFDPSHRWGCLQGRTATGKEHIFGSGWRGRDEDEVYEMEVERPCTDDGTALSAIDANEIGRPELMTSTPVKEGLAQEMIEELEKLCVSSAIHRHPENPDFAIRVFEVPIVGFRKGQGVVMAKDLKVELFSPPARMDPEVVPPKLTTLACGPPEEVLEQSLLRRAKLSWKGCAEVPTKRSDRPNRWRDARPRKAAVSYPTEQQLMCGGQHLDCWIQDAPGSYLEADLGANSSVKYVSTAGRFPPTETYPSAQLKEKWRQDGHTRPTGSRHWAVVKPETAGWKQWVTRYELQARLDAGRTWDTIAILKGNADMTTEVAHDMREVCKNPEGLKCRYLRFIPVSFVGKAAMRIGVYGEGLKGEGGAQKKPKEDEKVRYIIPVPLTNRNRRRAGRDYVRRCSSPEWYGKYGEDFEISTRRRKLAREAAAQGREALGRDRKALLLRQDSAFCDPDEDEEDPEAAAKAGAGEEGRESIGGQEAEAEAEAAPAEPAPAEPARPVLRRAMSRRVEEAMTEQPVLQRTRTDDERGYCSEPEDLVGDWVLL